MLKGVIKTEENVFLSWKESAIGNDYSLSTSCFSWSRAIFIDGKADVNEGLEKEVGGKMVVY